MKPYRTHLRSFCQSGRIAKSGGLKVEGGVNGVFKRRNRLIVGNNRAIITAQEENKTPSVDLRGKFSTGYCINSRMVATGQTYPKIFHPIQRFSGITNSGVKMRY